MTTLPAWALERARELLMQPPPPKARPTVDELEKILQSPSGPPVHINPDGSIRAGDPPEHLMNALAVALVEARAMGPEVEAISISELQALISRYMVALHQRTLGDPRVSVSAAPKE